VLPQLTLKWHYRSKNEALIAFSNSKIYHNSLITFPAPFENETDEGVEYIYVKEGVYKRSGKRNNPIEANRVVDVIYEQMKKYPNRSMGVITFSEAQQSCVEAALLARRMKDNLYEDYFREDNEEPFFIKNLENVQGDERDTIIFSIGYGKANPQEDLKMNFGPLNKEGGERRLNVAITRAKYSIKLVGSILPTDMNITDEAPKGVRLLRDYIEYAQQGVKALENSLNYTDNINTESPFEDSVYDYLVRNGYDVRTQVGCSGYRIDMAVLHPSLYGRFVLGIECDGATYHSSRTARERDRLRQSVLESMGWKIYRIWSTDWVKDPLNEGKHLLQAVDNAIKGYDELDVNNNASIDKHTNENYEMVVDKQLDEDSKGYGFNVYREKIYPKQMYEVHMPRVADAIEEITREQAPINIELVCKQVAPLYCNTKVTKKVRDGVSYILNADCFKDRDFVLKEGYLWLKNQQEIVPRVPAEGEKPRPLDKIAPAELAEAMYVIIDKSIGIEQDSLFKVVSKEYGFSRTTENMFIQLEKAFSILEKSGRVKNIDGKLSLDCQK
jgi:very-short-patch-repair endonuclease